MGEEQICALALNHLICLFFLSIQNGATMENTVSKTFCNKLFSKLKGISITLFGPGTSGTQCVIEDFCDPRPSSGLCFGRSQKV